MTSPLATVNLEKCVNNSLELSLTEDDARLSKTRAFGDIQFTSF